jgi:hypothetical protein
LTAPETTQRQPFPIGLEEGEGRHRLWSAAAVAGFVLATLILLAPALWNGYPLLQYDTGGYLARWYEGYLVPSRSTAFGIYLHAGEGLHFSPELLVQSVLTVWIIGLVLRLHGMAGRGLGVLAMVAVLSAITTLPWLTSILLTDIFAGLSVLALHLLIFQAAKLSRAEAAALFAVVAFSAATHSATFAVLLAILGTAALARIAAPKILAARRLVVGAAAVGLGALLLLTANYALSGRLAWTPGGFGIAFGRMLQDGIVRRFLDDHCPEAQLKLCPYRDELPSTADEFLWDYGVFNRLGRFEGLGDEMRSIVLRSLVEYPGLQVVTALEATALQLVLVATGAGVHDELQHTYGIVERFIPREVPAMRAARQQRGELGFERLNRLHVPVALVSMLALPFLLLRLRADPGDRLALLAGSVSVALLTNAFVCGALSGPHDRYGARLAWLATLVVLLGSLEAPAYRADTG